MLRILSLVLLGWSVASVATLPVAAAPDLRATPIELAIEDGTVSVQVTEGSLIALVEELGQRLGFEVIAYGVEDKPVTLYFARLSQRDAIRVICQRVGYVEVPDPVTGRTARLVLTPSRGGSANRLAGRRDPLPERKAPPQDPVDAKPSLAVDDDSDS